MATPMTAPDTLLAPQTPSPPDSVVASCHPIRHYHVHSPPSTLISTSISLLTCRLILLLLLTFSLPPTALSQAAPGIQNFVFFQLPNGRAVAHSTLDQGDLVLSRLRTRRSLQPLQTMGGFQARVRPSRDEEEQQAGGPVYECTSLDGPECSFVRGGQANDAVLRVLQNLMAQGDKERAGQRRQQQNEAEQSDDNQPAYVTAKVSSGRDSDEEAVAPHAAAPAQHSDDDQLTVSDDSTEATPADPADESPLTAEEQAYYDELSSLSLSQLIMHRAMQRDGLAGEELDGGDDIEYELLTVDEDGVQREMTDEEKEVLRQQLLNGEVDIEMEDEDDEPYWDEDGSDYNATSGDYDYGEDEELVANGVH